MKVPESMICASRAVRRPGKVWSILFRVVETAHGTVIHLINLTDQSETGWLAVPGRSDVLAYRRGELVCVTVFPPPPVRSLPPTRTWCGCTARLGLAHSTKGWATVTSTTTPS